MKVLKYYLVLLVIAFVIGVWRQSLVDSYENGYKDGHKAGAQDQYNHDVSELDSAASNLLNALTQ